MAIGLAVWRQPDMTKFPAMPAFEDVRRCEGPAAYRIFETAEVCNVSIRINAMTLVAATGAGDA